MARRRECANTGGDTKKLKQVLKAKSCGAKTRAKKKDAGMKSRSCLKYVSVIK